MHDIIEAGERGVIYRIFSFYVRIIFQHFYFRKVYYIDKENIPADCPVLVVADHQNGVNDVLGVIFGVQSCRKRKVLSMARSDSFEFPVLDKIFRNLGLRPAYRLDFQGLEDVSKNKATFAEVSRELLSNGTVIMFPEMKDEFFRFLRKFSYGYLTLSFETAEKSDFKKEVFILPVGNHYSDYSNKRHAAIMKFGKPISLAPYYELYKSKPRTAQRQVNELVRNTLNELILNISDWDNYQAIDYLRNTYGMQYAVQNGFKPQKLPEKLLADKRFVAALDAAKTATPEKIQAIYADAASIAAQLSQLKISDGYFDKPPSCLSNLLHGFLLLLLLPLFVCALLPHSFIVVPVKLINAKIPDMMMKSAVEFILSLIVTVPLMFIVVFTLTWVFTGSFIAALLALVALPYLGVFAWHYFRKYQSLCRRVRFCKLLHRGKLQDMMSKRQSVWERLDVLFERPISIRVPNRR
jgi:1-acyl-sn-glycerol-3-phosphate acyltransferase